MADLVTRFEELAARVDFEGGDSAELVHGLEIAEAVIALAEELGAELPALFTVNFDTPMAELLAFTLE